MKIGLLIFETGKSKDVRDVIRIAMSADNVGCTKFWLGEHYTTFDWGSPEPLIPVILGVTENISAGSAAMLLKFHSPYRIACSFRTMAALFPERVDLGVAAGLAANNKVISYLSNSSNSSIENVKFIDRFVELINFYNNEDELLSEGVFVTPVKVIPPKIWTFGLSNNGLKRSLEYKTCFSRSLFHKSSDPNFDADTLLNFKKDFKTKYGEDAQTNLAISGIRAKTRSKAKTLLSESYYASEEFVVANFLGDTNEFKDRLEYYMQAYKVDELIWLDLSPDIDNRLETIEVIGDIINS